LTTRPNELAAPAHDRMPVILSLERLDEWLMAEPSGAARLIRPVADGVLVATQFSKRVNSVKHDDPECVAAAEYEPPRQRVSEKLCK
jgi:putative SOS response-associated peptidase YedK